MIRIAVYYDGKPVQESEFDGATVREITVGHAPGCVIRLDEATVSRLHAVIYKEGEAWVLERKASFGAVRVNGEEVENVLLQGGEEVSVGKFVLRVQLEEGTPSVDDSSAATGVIETPGEPTRTRGVDMPAIGMLRIDPGMANVGQFAMDKDKAVFGRASSCDVALSEKKASRRHFEVRREGRNYILKDLNSANGTFLNGQKVGGESELSSGDEIRVGETAIQFTIESPEYFQQQEQFLPVPAEAEEAPASSLPAPQHDPYPIAHQSIADPAAGSEPADFGLETKAPETKSLFVKWYRKYKTLPVGRRYLTLLLLLAAILFIFDDEEPTTVGVKPKKKEQALLKDLSGKILRVYENLSKERKELVDKSYTELKEAFDRKDFPRVLERATTILNFVDDFKETKFYEARAKQAVEQKERDDRAKEQLARQQRIREEVVALEQKGADVYAKALKDPSLRPSVMDVVQEIYSKDPNNRLAQEWTDGLKEKEAEEARKIEEERKARLLKQKGDDAFALVEKKVAFEKYIEILADLEKLETAEWSTKEYLGRINDLRKQVTDKLNEKIRPLMAEAEDHRSKNGDLVKAKDLYSKVLEVDPKHEGAIRGLEAIKGILHTQAKKLYAEAILAESVSDLAEAKEKFFRCEQAAPEGDIYKKRCQNKLLRYESFPTGGGT